jgi:predicted PolB exonuclease-like 3'-5' exonuclease
MKTLTFDCETVPRQDIPDDLKPQFDPESVKVGNIKDQAKIDEKIETARKEFDEGLIKKMSLDPDLCEVVMVSFFDGERIESIGLKNDEYDTVYEAWARIISAYQNRIPLISYNGIGFDLPVLLHAAIRLDVPVSPYVYSAIAPRYGNNHHYDLMQILAGWDRTRWKPLDFYLKLFNIGAKTGEGSGVYGLWQAKEYDKIREYCEQDVLMTAKLFDRLSPWIVKDIEEV